MTRSNRLFQKTLVFFLILCLMTLSFTSCRKAGQSDYESFSGTRASSGQSETEANSDPSVQTAFDQFTRELFCKEIADSTLNLHFTVEDPASYGISQTTPTLGSFGMDETRQAGKNARSYLKELKTFSYEKLSENQKLTWDILENTLSLDAQASDFPYYDEALQPSIGLQSQLPSLLAEYTFHTEQDITDYLTLLKDVPRYFGEIITYEQEKSKAGLFMSDYCADLIIKECETFSSQADDGFLITTFQERLDNMKDLDAAKKQEYEKENAARVTSDLVDAYRKLADALTALKGTGKNEGGLSAFPHGKKYYNYILKVSTGSDRSVKELEEKTLKQVNSDLSAMQKLLKEHPELNDKAADFSFSLTDPDQILSDLQQKMADDFPALETNIKLQVKYVSKSMEEILSPAFYLTPPIDNLTDNVIYINGGYTDASDLYSTLAHEGYPGHLYQTVYSSSCNPDPIRQLCSVSGYSEGWATYVENIAYGYDTGVDSNLASLMQHNSSANLGIYALLDFYIHYEGWDLKQTGEWLGNFYSISDDAQLKKLYYTIVSQPCNYLKYYVGYLEFLDLKEDAQKKLGKNFSLKDFHAFLLEIGDAPFYIIRDQMKTWISRQ